MNRSTVDLTWNFGNNIASTLECSFITIYHRLFNCHLVTTSAVDYIIYKSPWSNSSVKIKLLYLCASIHEEL